MRLDNIEIILNAKKQISTHPTIKSLALIEYLVKLTLMPNPDQIYLDPFCGSGTTCIAVKKLGKNYIGIEQDESYVAIAHKRIEAVQSLLTLFK